MCLRKVGIPIIPHFNPFPCQRLAPAAPAARGVRPTSRNSHGNHPVACKFLGGGPSMSPSPGEGTRTRRAAPEAGARPYPNLRCRFQALQPLGAALPGAAPGEEPLLRSCRYFKNKEGAGAVATRGRGCSQRSTSRFLSAAHAAFPGISDAKLALKLPYRKNLF